MNLKHKYTLTTFNAHLDCRWHRSRCVVVGEIIRQETRAALGVISPVNSESWLISSCLWTDSPKVQRRRVGGTAEMVISSAAASLVGLVGTTDRWRKQQR